jgi:TPR repeat protein
MKDAMEGDVDAQSKLGTWHQDCCLDTSEATKWFRKAANLGYAPAQYHLGRCYLSSSNLSSQNKATGFMWVHKAAEQGLTVAQAYLGLFCYGHGTGVAKSNSLCVKWVRKAAHQGNAAAQLYLGVLYFPKNDTHAKISLASPFSEDPSLLSFLTPNKDKALKWWKKAAAQGGAVAEIAKSFLGILGSRQQLRVSAVWLATLLSQ